MNSQTRILVLIISSPGQAYHQFKNNWNLYLNNYASTLPSTIDTFFIEMNETLKTLRLSGNTMTFPGRDSIIPGCLEKTIQALNILDLTKYDYVVRTNLSSVVDYPRLQDHLSSVPKSNYYAGVVMDYGPRKFCSGALFILSTDVAQIFVGDVEYSKSRLNDDVYMAFSIQDKIKGIKLANLNRLDDSDSSDSKFFHYRFKTENRMKDTIRHRSMVEQLCGIVDLKPPARALVEAKYIELKNKPSDINQHLPTLRQYAMFCDSIVECGTRSIVSSWALLDGLTNDIRKTAKLASDKVSFTMCDLETSPNIIPLAKAARTLDVDFKFVKGDDTKVDLPEADLYFIDTWHIYAHLLSELRAFRHKAKKFIIMHDTTVDGIHGEARRYNANLEVLAQQSGYKAEDIGRGLIPAIDDFLAEAPEWRRIEVFTNNNGLTVLGHM
jgi:hypothetical protein